ncbi:chromosome segregation protein ParM [Aeromonas sp. Y311-2]|uniref:chromosome segregation protein ParM n=1 Tax=Aeromonas sp. Y311-2 TaxID=2990507 RepID=UPI0022E1D9F8|nr:chromosome segregation protein ParM [Aeromonas sp. Y311-2]
MDVASNGSLFICDMIKGGAMRLSATQKDILFVLYAMSLKRSDLPIPAVTLLKLLNNPRAASILPNNFRVSCHTLVKHQMLTMYRNEKSLQLAFTLTEDGYRNGERIYTERTSAIN